MFMSFLPFCFFVFLLSISRTLLSIFANLVQEYSSHLILDEILLLPSVQQVSSSMRRRNKQHR